jgi:hypothetical protein
MELPWEAGHPPWLTKLLGREDPLCTDDHGCTGGFLSVEGGHPGQAALDGEWAGESRERGELS